MAISRIEMCPEGHEHPALPGNKQFCIYCGEDYVPGKPEPRLVTKRVTVRKNERPGFSSRPT